MVVESFISTHTIHVATVATLLLLLLQLLKSEAILFSFIKSPSVNLHLLLGEQFCLHHTPKAYSAFYLCDTDHAKRAVNWRQVEEMRTFTTTQLENLCEMVRSVGHTGRYSTLGFLNPVTTTCLGFHQLPLRL